MQQAVSHIEHGQRGEFFMEENGRRIATMSYRRLDASRILIDHTEVDPRLRGRGIARTLLDTAVAWARRTGTAMSATCSYVLVQFERDASLRDVQQARN